MSLCDGDILNLLEILSGLCGGHRRAAWSFPDLVRLCRKHGLFPWLIANGKENEQGEWELTYSAAASLGIVLHPWFPNEIPRLHMLKNQTFVQTFKRGRNRHRKYIIEI